ncbi:MAG: hypothetical protein QOD90_1243 [Mycobacterium sp.]|jgi:hypothetical protein|nr:hypothetical protein [Mycobacterium sp.]
MKQISRSTGLRRIVVGLATSVLVSGSLGLVGLGVGEGIAHADDGGWGPPKHWCPGELPVPATGNHIYDPLNWDWSVCHTYYYLYQGMGNVSNMIWDGDNPPPKPPPPMGIYCDPGTFFQNCRIGDHP